MISNLHSPEKTETEGISPIVVSEVAAAEPAVAQTQTQADKLPPAPPIKDETDEVANADETQDSRDTESNDTDPETSETPTQGGVLNVLTVQTQEKLDKKTAELEDMRAMLAILEERNNDPERIALYKQLIEKTEKEIGALKNDLDRYLKA